MSGMLDFVTQSVNAYLFQPLKQKLIIVEWKNICSMPIIFNIIWGIWVKNAEGSIGSKPWCQLIELELNEPRSQSKYALIKEYVYDINIE